MEHAEKRKCLESITSEDELRLELVIPLLKKMPHFTEILDNQGADEAGADVIGVSSSPFKAPIHTAFVLKHGNISLKAADQRNNLINIVETQVRQVIRQPLSHPRLASQRTFATHVIVVTNGTISRNAEHALRTAFKNTREIDIDFVGQDRLIDHIDEYWPRFYDDRRPFLSTYAKKIFDSLDVVNLELLGYSQKQRSLTDIYIDTWLFPQESIAKHDLLPKQEAIAGAALCSQRHRLIVITSGPGGGKTTLLKELAILHSQKNNGPVAVYLHAREILASTDLIHTAAESLSSLSGDALAEVYSELKSTNLLFLIDGLDELGLHSDREIVITTLRNAVKSDNGMRVVLASRPESNVGILAALTDFVSYSISPLRTGQIRAFFGKWFAGNAEKATKLLDALRDKGVFDKLPRTPMTMTLVAIVFESKEDLPSTLTDLYQMFVELLTGKWDSNRKIASAFDAPMKVGFLERLAWVMHSERLEVIGYDRAIDVANEFLTGYATLKDVDAIQFIQSIIDRSQILIPGGRDLLRFSHMTFQEFFCAQYLAIETPLDETVLAWYGDDWWKEVLFFIAGRRKDISRLLDVLLKSDHTNPESRLTKLTTLGSMLQAGLFTKRDSKLRAIGFAAERFVLCVDDIKNAVGEIGSTKISRRFTRSLIIGILQEMFSSNFTSTYLKEALLEAYGCLPSDSGFAGARFFLCSALARLGVFEPMLEFATDPRMVDTAMYLMCRVELSGERLSASEKAGYKKVKARIKTFESAIRREIRMMGGPPRSRTNGGRNGRKAR